MNILLDVKLLVVVIVVLRKLALKLSAVNSATVVTSFGFQEVYLI